MKYLVLLLVVVGAVWWLRQSGRGMSFKQPASTDTTQDMVACAHCHVHVPRGDAVAGTTGVYCCAEHRQQREG